MKVDRLVGSRDGLTVDSLVVHWVACWVAQKVATKAGAMADPMEYGKAARSVEWLVERKVQPMAASLVVLKVPHLVECWVGMMVDSLVGQTVD